MTNAVDRRMIKTFFLINKIKQGIKDKLEYFGIYFDINSPNKNGHSFF